MRGGRIWLAMGLVAIASGCQSTARNRSIASAEPALTTPAEPGTTVVATQPPRTMTFVDRHPLFSKPRQYYDTSGDNKLGKVAAATVIGIPAGIVGEIKQIVVGAPPAPQY